MRAKEAASSVRCPFWTSYKDKARREGGWGGCSQLRAGSGARGTKGATVCILPGGPHPKVISIFPVMPPTQPPEHPISGKDYAVSSPNTGIPKTKLSIPPRKGVTELWIPPESGRASDCEKGWQKGHHSGH